MKNNFFSTRRLVGIAILLAIQIVLQLFGNIIQLGPVSINLSLITVALSGMIYGPWIGLFFGFVNGTMVLAAPSTTALFTATSFGGTILTCLTKCSLAGLISGFVYKILKNKNENVAVIVASTLLPLINTAMFIMYSFIFYLPLLETQKDAYGGNVFLVLLFVYIGWNFIIELITTSVVTPIIFKSLKKRNFGILQ